jgi:methionine sulfoxide reductase heme-binding subunit
VSTAATGSAYWYFARGTGVVSLLLLTVSIALGVVNVSRWRSERWPAFVITGLHRNLTLVALSFVGVHVLMSVADSYTPVRLVDAVVPFVSAYRPVWLGLGAVAFDLLVALIVTSLLRARIGYRRWKATHWFAYAAWPVALVHGIGTGSDARAGWMVVLTFCCVAVVLVAVLWRLLGTPEGDWSGRRIAGALGAVALPLALFGWMHTGPLKRGWAARAGTPSALLGSSSGSTASQISSATVPERFSAQLQGTLSQSEVGDQGDVEVAVDGLLSGGFSGRLRLVLIGQRLETGGVRMTSSRLSVGPGSGPFTLVGRVVQLDGPHVLGALTEPSGRRVQLALDLRIDAGRRFVSGDVSAAPISQ